MKIINKTKQTTLAENVIEPKSLTDQSLGLLKYKTPTAMLLKSRFGIHTFGMKYAIDVLILDQSYHVVSMKESMSPNDVFIWNPKYFIIIEIPAKTIKKTYTEIADVINIIQ